MNYKTHVTGGLLAGVLTISIVSNKFNTSPNLEMIENALFISSSVIGSLLPDIDHRGSYIGRRAKIVSTVVNKTLGHRGAIHSPIIMTSLTGILYFLLKQKIQSSLLLFGCLGLLVGIFSHILLDSFTIGGIPLLYPFSKKKYSLLKISTGGVGESLVLFSMVFMIGYMMIK